MATPTDSQNEDVSTVDWNAMDGMLHERLAGEMIRNEGAIQIQAPHQLEQLPPQPAPPPAPPLVQQSIAPPEQSPAHQMQTAHAADNGSRPPHPQQSQFTFTPAMTRKLLKMVAEMSAGGQRPRRQDYARRMRQILGTGPFPDAEKIRLKIKSEKERFERQVKLNSRSDKPKVEIDQLLIDAFAPNGIPSISSVGSKRSIDRPGSREPSEIRGKRQKLHMLKKQRKSNQEGSEEDAEYKQDNILETMAECLKTLATKQQDEDDLWLLSLGPALKRLEPLQKGLVKIKIQQFLLEAEFGVEMLSSTPHMIQPQQITPSTHQQLQQITTQHTQHTDHHVV